MRFPVKIINDPWFENEAGYILLFTCNVESTLVPAPRSTIVDEAVTPGIIAKAQEWSVDEVVRRWLSVFPLRDTAGKALPVSQARIELLAQDAGWVAKVRQWLGYDL